MAGVLIQAICVSQGHISIMFNDCFVLHLYASPRYILFDTLDACVEHDLG